MTLVSYAGMYSLLVLIFSSSFFGEDIRFFFLEDIPGGHFFLSCLRVCPLGTSSSFLGFGTFSFFLFQSIFFFFLTKVSVKGFIFFS
jgi:hypothetical protein